MKFVIMIIARTAHNLKESKGLYFFTYPPNEYKKTPVHTVSKPPPKFEITRVLHENWIKANKAIINIT